MHHRLIATVVLAAACAPADQPTTDLPATPQEVTYTASDFSYTGPDTIAPGLTTFRMVNNGAQEHHIILGHLADGKTMADLLAAFQADPNSEPAFLTFVGGAGAGMATTSTSATQDLAPGRYVLICFLPDASDNMVPHFVKGMIKEIVVSGTRHEAAAPAATVEVGMNEFGFTAPDSLVAGSHTFRVSNAGVQTHEVALVKLNDGATMEQFLAALAPGSTTPPPGVPLGGNGALSPHGANFFTASLEPGNYLLVCFVPDPADGTPHIVKGMVKPLTITVS